MNAKTICVYFNDTEKFDRFSPVNGEEASITYHGSFLVVHGYGGKTFSYPERRIEKVVQR